jgi:hypothetical protein
MTIRASVADFRVPNGVPKNVIWNVMPRADPRPNSGLGSPKELRRCNPGCDHTIAPPGRTAREDLDDSGPEPDQYADLPSAIIGARKVKDQPTTPGSGGRSRYPLGAIPGHTGRRLARLEADKLKAKLLRLKSALRVAVCLRRGQRVRLSLILKVMEAAGRAVSGRPVGLANGRRLTLR